MIDKILSFIAPHHCCGCDKIGALLCDNCKYNIKCESKAACITCSQLINQLQIDNTRKLPYERIWIVGERDGILQRLIGNYKFERTRSAYKELGDLLLEVLPELPTDTIIIPVPTVSGHVRERGYDHMLLIARYVAKAKGLELRRSICRLTNTKQRQSTARQRLEQAKKAFVIDGKVDINRPYLLLDDVITTGATIKYASQILRDAGVKHVWVAVIARQTLD